MGLCSQSNSPFRPSADTAKGRHVASLSCLLLLQLPGVQGLPGTSAALGPRTAADFAAAAAEGRDPTVLELQIIQDPHLSALCSRCTLSHSGCHGQHRSLGLLARVSSPEHLAPDL